MVNPPGGVGNQPEEGLAAQIVDPRKRGVGPTDDIHTVVIVKISILHRVRRAWSQPKWFFRPTYHFAQVIVPFQRVRLACRFKGTGLGALRDLSSRQHRDELGQNLGTLGAAYCLIETHASEQTLRRRLIEREGKTNEAPNARL